MRSIVVSLFLIVLSILVAIPSLNISPVSASGSQSWSFRDDFNYTSISQLQTAGWTVNPNPNIPLSYYGLSNSTMILKAPNGPDNAASISRSDIPANVSNWSVSIRVESTLNLRGNFGTMELPVPTVGHLYEWTAHGYYSNFQLIVDHVIVATFPGYSAQLNVWHVLRLDMINGTVNMYFDGTLLGSYSQPDKTPGNTNLSGLELVASAWNNNGFDWIQASSSPVPPTPFFTLTSSTSSISLAYHQSVNATITVTSKGGFTGAVNLVASSQSGGPSVTMVPATVSVSNGGSALSTLELQAPVDPISPATYSVNVTGSDGALSTTVSISVVVDTRAPIYINGNSGFRPANGVNGGSGTKSDPYIISGFAIDLCQPGMLCGGSGIFVNNTSMSFIISNVYVHSSGPIRSFGYYDADVYLLNVANAVVENSTLTGSRSGVTVSGSTNVTISGNMISDQPIYTVGSNGVSYQTTGPCITVSSSTNVVVSGNTIGPCVGGMVANGATNMLVYRNSFLAGTNTTGAPFASDSQGSNNKWDNGYPSGGNYWSDYTGVDNCSGPQQNICPSPDGIGDTPYSFSSAQDRYPLMKPFVDPPAVSYSVHFQTSSSANPGTVSRTISVIATNSTSGEMIVAAKRTVTYQ